MSEEKKPNSALSGVYKFSLCPWLIMLDHEEIQLADTEYYPAASNLHPTFLWSM